jgi:hypothetical protein
LINTDEIIPTIGCSAHLIQLAINDTFESIEDINSIINKSSNIVQKFKKSGPANCELIKAQQECGMSENEVRTVLQKCKTRWNSCYFMLKRLHFLSKAVILACSKIDDIPTIRPCEWKLINELLLFLDILEVATRKLCGDKYSTASWIIPTINTCIDDIESVDSSSVPSVLKVYSILFKSFSILSILTHQ